MTHTDLLQQTPVTSVPWGGDGKASQSAHAQGRKSSHHKRPRREATQGCPEGPSWSETEDLAVLERGASTCRSRALRTVPAQTRPHAQSSPPQTDPDVFKVWQHNSTTGSPRKLGTAGSPALPCRGRRGRAMTSPSAGNGLRLLHTIKAHAHTLPPPAQKACRNLTSKCSVTASAVWGNCVSPRPPSRAGISGHLP